jgi:hypothetical protein
VCGVAGGKYSTPHLFTASNWSDPATYKYSSAALFSKKVVKGAIEDMFMWVDKRGGYHTLFHLMYGCDTCGSHAYSVRDAIHSCSIQHRLGIQTAAWDVK